MYCMYSRFLIKWRVFPPPTHGKLELVAVEIELLSENNNDEEAEKEVKNNQSTPHNLSL